MRATWLVLAGVIGMSGAAARADESADRAAIAAIVADQGAAWNRADAAGYSAHIAPQVVFTNILGGFAVGRDSFTAAHTRIFATVFKGSTLRLTIERVTFVRPDVAIVDTLSAMTGFVAVPPGIPAPDGVLRTRLEQVMVRDAGGWSVASYHNVAVNPAAIAATGGPPPPR